MGRTLPIAPTMTAPARLAGHRHWAARRLAGAPARRITPAATVACASLLGVFLVRGHLFGGEARGLVAAIAGVAAGALSLAADGGAKRRLVKTTIVTLWTIVIVLGVTGTFDHAKVGKPEYADQRTRPVLVPLVFSTIGGAAMAAIVPASRRRIRVEASDGEAHR